MTIHTAYGPGEIVEVDKVGLGKTRYKVAGMGFEVWLDGNDPAIHTAADVFGYEPQMEMAQQGAHIPGTPTKAPHFGGDHADANDAWGMHTGAGWHPPEHVDEDPDFDDYEDEARHHHEAATFDFEPTTNAWDNSTTLPYNWQPQAPVEMFRHEQTQSPDHSINLKKRMRPSDSNTGEERDPIHEYPGPAPHLFAKEGWTFHDQEHEGGDHENDDNRWDRLNHNALDSAHVAGVHPDDPHQWEPGGYPESTDHYVGEGLHDSFEGGPVGNPEHDNRMPHEIPWGPDHPDYDGVEIPPWHRAQEGEPSAQDHVNADAMRVQQDVGNDTSNPAHPDFLPPHHQGKWERPAGLSSKYADIHDAADHFNDPVQRFLDDPHGAINRHAQLDIEKSGGLDPDIGDDMHLASVDFDIRTAAWTDVRQKATRLVRAGAVHVEAMDSNAIYANVDGDNDTYEVMILNGSAYPTGGFSGGKRAIANWKCSCPWGQWAFKRQMTFVGRLCSHGYATYLTQASHNAKNDRTHPFHQRNKRQKAAGIVEDFKSWVDDENGGHVDLPAADNWLSVREEPVSSEEAQKVYDYVDNNVSEHPERDYDQKGYSANPDDAYKGDNLHHADLLRHQPGKLTPHIYEAPELSDEDRHYFTDLGDDRKTTGPDQIQARKTAQGEAEPKSHHPAFAWHAPNKADFPEDGIVHFSRRFMADEDLIQKLRDDAHEPAGGDPHNQQDRNREISEIVQELNDRGYAASQFVASKTAIWKTAEPSEDDELKALHGAEDQAGYTPPANAGLNPGVLNNAGNPVGGEVGGLPRSVSGPGPGGSGGATPPPPTTTVSDIRPAPAPAAAAAGGGGSGPLQGPHAPGQAVAPTPKGVQPDGSWQHSLDTTAISPGNYTVKPGDTANDIAGRAGVGFGDIKGLGSNPDLITPGQTLGIGGGSAPKNPIGPPTSAGTVMGKPSTNTPAGGGSPASPAGLSGGGTADYKGWYGKGGAKHFAQLYFLSADDSESSSDSGDDPNKKTKVTSPTQTTPSGALPPGSNQGQLYKQVSQGDPQQQRPQNGSVGTDVHSTPQNNPLGAPGAGTVGQGPAGAGTPGTTTSGPPGLNQKQQEGPGGPGGNMGGGGLSQALSVAEPFIQGIGGALSGLPVIGPAIGGITNALSGLSGLGHLGSTDAERFASRYFQADGDFLGQGGADWMDYSFAGSGPDRQDWSGTSEDYVDKYERPNRSESWLTDNKGDITKYTERPKQAALGGDPNEHNYFGGETGNEAPHSAIDGGPHGFPGMGGFGLGDGSGNNGPKITPLPPGTGPGPSVASRRVADGGMLGGGDAGFGSTGGIPGGTLSAGGMESGGYNAADGGGEAPTMGQLTNTAAIRNAFGPAADNGYFNPRNPKVQPMEKQPQQKQPKGQPKPSRPLTPGQDTGVDDTAQEAGTEGVGGIGNGGLPPLKTPVSGGLPIEGSRLSDDAIADRARGMLRTAGRIYTLAEQRELEDEFHPRGARNLSDLDLRGTHYEDE